MCSYTFTTAFVGGGRSGRNSDGGQSHRIVSVLALVTCLTRGMHHSLVLGHHHPRSMAAHDTVILVLLALNICTSSLSKIAI